MEVERKTAKKQMRNDTRHTHPIARLFRFMIPDSARLPLKLPIGTTRPESHHTFRVVQAAQTEISLKEEAGLW
jgi:hypothetical protein